MAKNPWMLYNRVFGKGKKIGAAFGKALSDAMDAGFKGFDTWTSDDFLGKRDEAGWKDVLKKDGKISISNPQSNRYWIEGDDSKYYSTNELEKADYDTGIKTDLLGNAEGQAETARVDSTAIDLISYDTTTKTLGITYKGGTKEYIFPNVPIEEFEALMEAPSKGKYVAYIIVPRYSVNYSK